MLIGAAAGFLACTVVLGASYVMPGFAAGRIPGAIPAALLAAASGCVVGRLLARPPGPKERALAGLITAQRPSI